MASGICSMGVDVLLVGPLPTPGHRLPHALAARRRRRRDLGVAQPVPGQRHQVLQPHRLQAARRASRPRSSALVVSATRSTRCARRASEIGKAFRIDDAVGRYNVFAKNTFPRHLTLDGLTRRDRLRARRRLQGRARGARGARRARGRRSASSPTARTSTATRGALHPEHAAGGRARRRARTSASRSTATPTAAILVDERGEVVDGDAVLAHPGDASCTRGASSRRDTLVATVMSNLGPPHRACASAASTVVTTPVGDRYVVEEMLRGGYNLGGEQSGHIVFLDHNTTGDGLITGARGAGADGRERAGRSPSCGA